MELLADLPNDLIEKVILIKEKEIKDIQVVFYQQVMKCWHKYCNCVDCKARRSRLIYYCNGYHESF